MNAASEREKMFYNAVWNAVGCSHREIAKLKSRAETWEEIFRSLPKSFDALDPEREWEKVAKSGIKLVLSGEDDFPKILREIYWPPHGVYFKGEIDIFEKPAIAVVGTRKATEDGLELARRFGREFGEAGVIVVSGLAFGIDSSAHKGCLDSRGKTAAVLACGLDEIYPKSNEKLSEEIISSGGAIISEYPPGVPPLPYRFIERNRLVSGLSLGVVVIEAPESSGSLATARFALEQNREVFVAPGPANHRNFSGSHSLIRSGARLATKASEVLEDLNIIEPAENGETGETPEEKKIFKIIESSAGPLGIDKISEIANLESRLVSQPLTLLLLNNRVKEENGEFIVND